MYDNVRVPLRIF